MFPLAAATKLAALNVAMLAAIEGSCNLLEVFRKSPAKMMLAMEDGDVERGNERGTGSPADELG